MSILDWDVSKIDLDRFAERVRILVAESSLSKAEFAKSLGVSYQTLHQYTRGFQRPEVQKLYRLSAKGGVSISWLLGEADIDDRRGGFDD